MSDNSMSLVSVNAIQPSVDRRITRFVLGVTVAAALAYGINWGLSFVMPVFLAKFLVDKPVLTRQIFDELFLAMVATVLIGLSISNGVTHYPLVLLLLVGLLMFSAYYLFMDPEWNLFATILIISALLIPYMGIINPAAALFLGKGLMISGIGAVVMFVLMHCLLPDKAPQSVKAKLNPVFPSSSQRTKEALRALMISFPVIAFFFYFQINGALLTLAFVGILSLQITGQKSVKLSAFLLLTNSIGGILAVIAYELLVTVPWFPFLVALLVLFTCTFANKIYSNPLKAPIWSGIFTALLVVLGSALSSETKEIDVGFYTRIAQIFLAGIYMIFISFLLESRNKSKHDS